jgi:NAD(P)-dependent dehydrogenase (short-subunit alcohol dehydrogenase family)
MQLLDRVALVTGAGSGIGKASAKHLAAEGATVAVLSLLEDEVDATCSEIAAAGGKAFGLVADISDEHQMRAATDRLMETEGRLDFVLANAGINGVWAPIDDLQPAEFDKTIAVNLRGTYLTLHFTVPHLKKAGGGSIVVISSINGTRTFTTAGATAYSATKAGQLAMVEQLALELGKHRIRVNAICPGMTATAIGKNTIRRNQDVAGIPVIWPEGDIPLTGGKAGTTDDVADVVVFLASDRSRHVTGCPIFVDGGQSLLR